MKYFKYFSLRIVLLCFILLAPSFLAAQFYPAKTYSIVDGLPSNAIYDVTQADNRVMWFLTSKGVTTYDAHQWYVFPDSLQIPTYQNSKLQKSKDGLIWVAGKNDTELVIKYYDFTEWKTIPFPEDWKQVLPAFTFKVLVNQKGHEIILAGVKSVFSYSTSTNNGSWKRLAFPDTDLPEINSTVNIDGRVYVNTNNGQFVIEEGQIKRSEYDSKFEEYKDILTVTKKDSTLYILGFDWLATLKDDQFTLLSEDLGIHSRSNYNRHSLIIDQRDRIFYSSMSRVMQFNRETGQSMPLEVNGRSNNIFSNKLYLDQENNIWSVDNRGLFKFNVLNFKSYNSDTGLADNEVSAILEGSDGTLYIANRSWLNVFQDGEIVQQYSLKADDEIQVRILQMAEHSDGSIYIAASNYGLYKLKNGELTTVFGLGDFEIITSVLSFEGELFFSNAKYIYQITDDGYERINQDGYQYIRNLVRLDDGVLGFLSATNGLYLFRDGKISNYTSTFLNYNNVFAAVNWNGHLLLGTSAGLATLKDGEIIPFPIEDFDDVVFSLLVDDKQQLWIGTFNGVFRWNGQVLEQFSVAQGLIGNEINRNALIQDNNGDIWIGTELGVSAFDDNEDMSGEKDPDLYFKSIIVDQQREIKSEINPQLPANLGSLAFDYLGISFLHNDKIFYRYRLSGLEDDWNFTNNFSNTLATYRNLDSGDYTFEIQARNEVSNWSEPKSYSFSVATPYYVRWWFILSAIIVATGVFYLILRLRYQFLIKKQKKLRELVEDRTKSISEKNTQIRLKNEELTKVNTKLQERTESLDQALRKLEKAQVRMVQKEKMAALGILTAGVAHEINNPINYIKSASEVINEMIEEEGDRLVIREKDVFAEVFKSIEIGVERIVSIVKSLSSFSRTNEEDRGECDINNVIEECLLILKNEYKGRVEIEKDFEQDGIKMQGNEGKLYQLFINIIMNAIQAIEGKGKVAIRTWKKEQDIYIEVKDTGKGFDNSVKEKLFDPFFTTKDPGKGTGLGLSIAYNIINIHNGDIYFDSIPGSGTKVTIKFSVEQD